MYESQSRARGMIITWVRNWNCPPSQFLHSNHKVRKNCKEEQGGNDDETDNLVKVTRISPSNHADAMLVHDPAISDDANAYDSVEIRKVPCDVVFGSVKKREGKSANQHSDVEIRNPRSFIGKPHFSFDLDWCCDFPRDPDLGRQRIDSMVVPDGRQVPFIVYLGLRNPIRSSIPRARFEVLRERSESGGREWSQHVGHGDP